MEATSLANSGKHFDAGWWSVVLQPEEEIAGSFQIEERFVCFLEFKVSSSSGQRV